MFTYPKGTLLESDNNREKKKRKSIALQATGCLLGSQFQNRDGARSYVAGAICQALSIIYLMAYNYELSSNKGDRELIESLSVWKAGKYHTSGFRQSPWYVEYSRFNFH